ncbi:DUF805 domain-containing protein [Flavobacterium tyrosinilyticum]|uniref:DUF805 domain-containing protein n=1 Tax=Flavobacterium tyrosinilyticum TaxID=1658740 RepID=UPI00202F9901|nr:DUF805 domain-containing protein [Flavobacterium tyrosinilyticum]MCM0665620.1 DUF805 domain-containing protein [Flavobacterium tyrosinilyticum]
MLEIYKKVVLQNYANFKGRARRKEFWMFLLANAIIGFVIGFLAGLISEKLMILASIFNLAILLPSIAVAVRRLQDVDKEWWHIFIPFYNIYLFCQDGTVGPNQYGADPKNRL